MSVDPRPSTGSRETATVRRTALILASAAAGLERRRTVDSR
jgi:hypothetical protein